MSVNTWSILQLSQGASQAPWRLLHALAPEPVKMERQDEMSPTVICRHADGVHFAVGDQYGALSLWTLENRVLTCTLSWKGHDMMVKALTWNGDRLISSSRDGTIAMWDGEVLAHRIDGHQGTINGLAMLAENGRFLSVGDDGSLCLWDVPEDEVERKQGHQGWATCVAVDPSGTYALTGSADANLVLWHLMNGEQYTWHGHVSTVTAVCFSPDGLHAASASEGGVLKIWEVGTGAVLCTLRGHEAKIQDLRWCGSVLVTGSADYRIGVWSFKGAKSHLIGWLQGHRRGVTAIEVMSDGKYVISAGADRSIGLWEIKQAHPTAIHHAGSVRSVAFSPNGEWLASGSRDETVWVRDVTNGERVLRLVGHKGGVQGVAFSPDASQGLLSVSTDGTARIWNLGSGRLEAAIQAHEQPVSVCTYSQNGHYFYTGARDGLTKVWSSRTATLVGVLEGHQSWVRSMAAHADGRLLTGSYDGTVCVWSPITAKLLAQFSGHVKPDGSPAPVIGVGILKNGTVAVSGGLDGYLRFWEIDNGRLIHAIHAHSEGLVGLVVHGPWVLSAAMDSSVRRWFVGDLEAAPTLDATLTFPVELDSIAAQGSRIAIGDRAGHTYFLGNFKEALRLDSTV